MESTNSEKILSIFQKLDMQYQNDSTKNQFQKNSIKKAVKLIDEYQKENGNIQSKKEALKIKGIGKSIGEKIDEILKTGTLKILKDEFMYLLEL